MLVRFILKLDPLKLTNLSSVAFSFYSLLLIQFDPHTPIEAGLNQPHAPTPPLLLAVGC